MAKFIIVCILFTLACGLPLNNLQTKTGEITPLNSGVGCYTLTDESDCLSSSDGRSTWAGQLCAWCCGKSCLSVGDKKCQPVGWLESSGVDDYEHNGEHATGNGLSTCPSGSVPKNCRIEVFDKTEGSLWSGEFEVTMQHDMFKHVLFPSSIENKADVVTISAGCRLVVLGDEDNLCRDIDYEDNIRVKDGTNGTALSRQALTVDLLKAYDINGRYKSNDVQNDLCGIWIMGEVDGKIKSNICTGKYQEYNKYGNCQRGWMHKEQHVIVAQGHGVATIYQGHEKYCRESDGWSDEMKPHACSRHW